MRRLADDLLELCAAALGTASAGFPKDFFTAVSEHPTHTLNVNWYPPLSLVGVLCQGSTRIGPHTDFGTVTVLDREPGTGGLQIWNAASSEWEDAPFVEDAFTINTGDLLARWSGDRWVSNRHRVLPPWSRRYSRRWAAEQLRAGGGLGVPAEAAGRDHRRVTGRSVSAGPGCSRPV